MRNLIRTLVPALIGVTLLAMGPVGCGPVASLEPIYTEKDVVFDPAALGIWYDGDDTYVHVTQAGEKNYRLLVVDTSEDELAMFSAHLVKLKNHMFLDLFPLVEDDGYSRLSAWYGSSVRWLHQPVLVKQLRPAPIIALMSEDYVEEHRPSIRHAPLWDDDDDGILITASTRKVQRFLLKAAKRGAFDDEDATMKWAQSKATALHFAAAQGNRNAIEKLIEAGADLDARDEENRTPLQWAEELQQKQAFGKALGVALHSSVERGDANLIKRLLDKGASVNVKNKDHETPLHVATRQGNAVIVELLLAKGADGNAKDWYGRTPLHVAARAGSVAIVELLLSKGADVNTKDVRNETPAYRATNPKIIELLKRHARKK